MAIPTNAEIEAAVPTDGAPPSRANTQAVLKSLRDVGSVGALTAAQQAVFDALAPTVPDSYGPSGSPVVITFNAASSVTLEQAADLAGAIASVRPVQLVLDGIIPAAKAGQNVFLRGNLMNLSIIGKPENNAEPPVMTAVVSCASVGGGRFDLVIQHAAALPSHIKVGGMYLFRNLSSILAPNSTWRGVTGAYLIKSVDMVNNRVTLDFANDVALTVGAASFSAWEYCGNVLQGTEFDITGQVRQLSGFGVSGGSFDTETESVIRTDGFIACVPGAGQIAFDIGGVWGGYVNSANFYAGTMESNGVSKPYCLMENPSPTSKTVAAGIYGNNFEVGLQPHEGAQILTNQGVALAHIDTIAISGLNWSAVYLPELRVHVATAGIELYAGSVVYLTGARTFTDVTTSYNIPLGAIQADGAAIFG